MTIVVGDGKSKMVETIYIFAINVITTIGANGGGSNADGVIVTDYPITIRVYL